MRTSIATVCLSGTLEEKMVAAARAGFHGIEVFEQDLVVSPSTPERVRELAADLGLSLDLYQPFRDGLQGTPEQFEDALRRLRAKCEVMNRLGTDTLLVCSTVGPVHVRDDEAIAEQLRTAGEVAAQYGVYLAYEALAWGTTVSDWRHAHRIVQAANHPHVGTCLDSFHIYSRGDTVDGVESLDPASVFFVQLADAPRLHQDVLSWSRHHRVFPGEGEFDLVDLLARLVALGYRGPVSLEIFNDAFRQADVQRTAVDGLRSLRWLEDRTARAIRAGETLLPPTPPADDASASTQARTPSGAPSAAATPDRPTEALALHELPTGQAPLDWDFVELHTAELGRTTRLLHQLGFEFVGHHRSKQHVQAWRQGPVRVVVSEDPAASAASAAAPAPQSGAEGPSLHQHADAASSPQPRAASSAQQYGAQQYGARLAGLGVQVADPQLAALRAERLLAPAVERTRQPGETELHGVVAPDGTEVFFGPRGRDGVPPWLEEFGAEPELPARDAVITGVDHVNLAQPWQHYDEAVLFLTSLLGLRAEASQDVPGPSGLVRSQVMRSSDDLIRIPLNVAPAAAEQGALTGAAYPEHVALACTDVLAVARRARRRGLEFLPVPPNYYEDLVARFDLDEAFVIQLRENGLLYDRDEHGEFLHFYTATLGEVFIEVVERRGGYRGFGAPNAPVRLAAQYRALGGGRI